MGIIPILVRIGRLGDRGAFLDHSLDALVLPAIGGTGPPLDCHEREGGGRVKSR